MDMHEVPFVDAHVHFWDLERLRYPWLTPPFPDDGPNGSVAAIAKTYLPSDYRAEAARWNIAGAVHIDAGAHPDDAIRETDWLEGECAAAGLPQAVIAHANLADPGIDKALASQAAHGRVRGIRHIVNWHPDPRRTYTPRDLTRQDGWARGFGRLAEYGLSFDLQCYPSQMTHFAVIARRHPQVPVMVNHLGMPVLSDVEGKADWRRGLRKLAGLSQVSIKLSGLGFIRRDWDSALVIPFIREAIDIFGPERAMAASDFPTDRLFADFDRALETLAEAIAPYNEAERKAIWGGNARRLYRIDLDLEGTKA